MISEGGRCAKKAVEREAPKRCAFSPDDSKKPLVSGMRSNRLYSTCYASCFNVIDIDILERQEDILERQKDSSERRVGNGEDYGHRERPTEVLGLQSVPL